MQDKELKVIYFLGHCPMDINGPSPFHFGLMNSVQNVSNPIIYECPMNNIPLNDKNTEYLHRIHYIGCKYKCNICGPFIHNQMHTPI